MSDELLLGTCLCGKVQYQITPPLHTFQYCYCSRCRKFTGSAFAANLFVPPAQFTWLAGEDQIKHYEIPEAKYFSTCFCAHCGSSLPWHTKNKANVIVPAGTLDGIPMIQPQQNIFCADQAAWYVSPHILPEHKAKPTKA